MKINRKTFLLLFHQVRQQISREQLAQYLVALFALLESGLLANGHLHPRDRYLKLMGLALMCSFQGYQVGLPKSLTVGHVQDSWSTK